MEQQAEPTPTITELGDDTFAIDTRMSGYPGITSAYLIRSDAPCLVEVGTATSAPVVRSALTSLGVGPDDLATVVVTHIHLDHAGGVGDVARMFPRARVVVQERGARHLVDPSRLVASARRVFGDEVVEHVFGPLLPTDAARVVGVGEEGSVDLGGGRRLDLFHAPGHASHHLGMVDSLTGDLYVGDAAGIWIPQTAELRPGCPPPDWDLDLSLASLERFRALSPTRLLFAHFGPVGSGPDGPDVTEVLDRSAEEMRAWVELVRQARHAHLDLDHAVAMVRERTRERYARLAADPELAARIEELASTPANIVGINRWLDRVEGSTHSFGDAAGAAPRPHR